MFLYKIPTHVIKFTGKFMAFNTSQTGAGPDKVIFDNLFSINSILEYMDVNELDGVLISFDQEKAFDRVEHIFICVFGICMPLILSLHLILDASVSIIRAYSDILRGHPCLSIFL
jgi:hypothetical protein